jgi:hypothetical protein
MCKKEEMLASNAIKVLSCIFSQEENSHIRLEKVHIENHITVKTSLEQYAQVLTVR